MSIVTGGRRNGKAGGHNYARFIRLLAYERAARQTPGQVFDLLVSQLGWTQPIETGLIKHRAPRRRTKLWPKRRTR